MKRLVLLAILVGVLAIFAPALKAQAAYSHQIAYSDGTDSYTYVKGAQSATRFATNAVAPEWSNDGISLAYINPSTHAIVINYDYDSDPTFITAEVNTFPVGITPKQLTWSPNDLYLAFSTVEGKVYSFDVRQGPISLIEASSAYSATDVPIIDIEWSLITNKVFYAKSDGIWQSNPDGSDRSLFYDPTLVGKPGQIIRSFDLYDVTAYNPTMMLIDSENNAYIYYDFTIPKQIFSAYVINSSQGVKTGIVHGNYDWLPEEPQYYINHTDGLYSIETADLYYSSPNIYFTAPQGSAITSISPRHASTVGVLYRPQITTSLNTDARQIGSTVHVWANSEPLLNTLATIQLSIYDTAGDLLQTTAPQQINMDSKVDDKTVTMPFAVQNDGDYYIGCRIVQVAYNPYTEQFCPMTKVTYTTPPVDNPPTAPQNLQFISASSSQISFSWQPSTDQEGVVGYGIIRNDIFWDTVDSTVLQYTDYDVGPTTTYTYSIFAWDTAAQLSSESSRIIVITPPAPIPVYRFWSPKNQHHFYTSSAQEMEIVRASYPSYIWTYEGVAFEAADDPGCQNSTPIYRFWSAKNQSHFYTASAEERDIIRTSYPENVWKYEGVAYCAAPSDDPDALPVYRFWSAKLQGHFYTNSAEERDIIRTSYPENVWKYEGVAYYAY